MRLILHFVIAKKWIFNEWDLLLDIYAFLCYSVMMMYDAHDDI